jgi:hypothetical protein
MPYNWGPHYIMPTEVIKTYSGQVLLCAEYNYDLLVKELEELKLPGHIISINNSWYHRKKGTQTWIKIGESSKRDDNFSVRWDTTNIANGKYEILGLMHVSVVENNIEYTIARQNIVDVSVENETNLNKNGLTW